MEFWNLRELKLRGNDKVTCPKCGKKLIVVQSGFVGGEYYYCSEENKVFGLQIKEVKKVNAEFYEHCKESKEWEDTKARITFKNIKAVKDLLDSIK